MSTPAPTATVDLGAVVTPPPEDRASVKGTILFTRGRDIWAISGLEDPVRLSRKGMDSSPDWAPDGSAIYFVETRTRTADAIGPRGKYTFYYPNIMKMRPNGKKRKELQGSLVRRGKEYWFIWLLQPDISPRGRTFALVSDGPDGKGQVTLHTLPVKGGRISPVRAPTRGDLGHNDPDWSPDGKQIAFTLNARSGPVGKPVVAIYNVRTRKTRLLKRGYANPSWSPDGTWLAAERTTGTGRDVVILDARRGDEVRLTNDGDSFSPVVSPDGDQIAYLHRDGLGIDLRIMTLAFDGGRITLVSDLAVTKDGSLDAESPAAWFIPPDERKPPPSAVIPASSPSPLPAEDPGG
jgi:Tol biopolymer transport system component